MATELTSEPLARLLSGEGAAVQPGCLHLIATPIGNLSDISLRACRWLVDVDHLYCEDTRVSQKLLSALGIRRQLVSLHEHNEAKRSEQIVAQLAQGESVGLVSDAGTPVLSDPGARLVAAVRAAGHPVTTAPGASAPTAALISSGLPVIPSTFLGFAPRKAGALATLLKPFLAAPGTLILFESPKRVSGLIERLGELAPDRPLVVARELTKRFETYHVGSTSEPPELPERGEMVVMIGPPSAVAELAGEALDAAIDGLLAQGLRAKEVAKALAAQADRRTVYRRCVERLACED